MPAPGDFDNTGIYDALAAYGQGGGSGPQPQDPYAQPSVQPMPQPQDPYSAPGGPGGPLQTPANALIDPQTGQPAPIQLPPTNTTGSSVNVPGANGPDTMSQGDQPVNPYGPAPAPAKPAKPLTPDQQITQSDAQIDGATTKAGEDMAAASLADNAAKTKQLTARGLNALAGVKAQQDNDQAYLRAQAANDAKADSDTVQWMKDQDKLAKEEPNPHRMWDNTSSFGKAMFISSLIFGAGAMAFGAKSNVGLDMLNQAMAEDMESQKESLKRQLEVGKEKGLLMDKQHQRAAAKLADEHTMRMGQLNSMSNALDIKLQAPGSDDDKAATMKAKAWVEQEKIKTAAEKNKQLREDNQKSLDRASANWRTGATISAENKRANNDLIEKGREADQTNQRDYDLAQISASAKLAEHAGAQDEFHKNLQPIPKASGAYLVNPKTGDRINIAVAKDATEKFSTDIQAHQAKMVGLATLRDALKGDTGWEQALANNDNEVRQALAALTDSQAKSYNMRLSPSGMKALQVVTSGEDTSSIIERLKGADTPGMIKLVEKQMKDGPGAIHQKLQAYPSNLADYEDKGYQLQLDPAKDTRAPASPNMTGAAGVKAATGLDSTHQHLTDSDSIDKYGDAVVKELPLPLQEHVAHALAAYKQQMPGIATQAMAETLADVDKYGKAHPDQAADVQDAKVVIAREGNKAETAASNALGHLEAVLRVSAPELSVADAKELATKEGVANITTAQIVQLLAETKKAREGIFAKDN